MTATAQDQEIEVAQKLLGQDGSFAAYFRYYNDLIQRDSDCVLEIEPRTSATISSKGILAAASAIKSNVSATRSAIEKHLEVATSCTDSNYNRKAVKMAIQAMFMVDPAANNWHSAGFTRGDYRPTSWLHDETLIDFIQRLFPLSLQNSREGARAAAEQRALKARKLQRHLGARFRPTNNLAEHLLFDERRNCLYIFHHVAFLKAHLGHYEAKPAPLETSLEQSLEEGTMPPQLLVETLYSIQAVLFPSIDPESAEILDELIARRDFDPDCAEYEGYKLFREPPPDFEFKFWGERMAHLHRLITYRPPRNRLERWFHQHGNERNALLIAFLALFISILVGVISIGLNCVQIWITWMAWKNPTPG